MENINNWIENIIHTIGAWVFFCAIGLLALIIVIIVICCVNGSKKKKAKKANAAPAVEEKVDQTVEETPVEEKEEAVPAEEAVEDEAKEETVKEEVKEEVAPVEEAKEEPVEEAKEEPTSEEVKEEPVVEAVPAKKVAKKAAKKEAAPAEEAKEEVPTVEEPKVEAAPAEEVKEEPVVEQKKGAVGKFVIVSEGPNWRYKLKASNGEVIIVSEPYKTEKAVRTGIETLKRNLEIATIDIVEDKHGLFSFRVMTKQGRCLATSANYKTKVRAVSASKSYMRWATTDVIILDEEGSADHTEVEKIDIQVEEVNTGTYVVKEEGNGFIYQLVAANKVVIATSQTYKSKDTCIEAIEKFRVCVYEGAFFVSKDKNDKFQFKLYNKQNRLVLAGEVYDDKSRVISVIEAIKRLAKLATVSDTTVEAK